MVELQWAVEPRTLPSKAQVSHWVETTLNRVGAHGDLTVRIVSPEEIQMLNATYRGKDRPTNVLSFPFDIPQEVAEAMEDAYLGDLAICAAVVEAEAREQNKLLEAHWAHMVVHGTLHLLGYDHMEAEQAQVMERLEIEILAELGFANPYEEV